MPKKEVKSNNNRWKPSFGIAAWRSGLLAALKEEGRHYFALLLNFASVKFERRRREIIEQYGDVPVFLEKVSFTTQRTSTIWTSIAVGAISLRMQVQTILLLK